MGPPIEAHPRTGTVFPESGLQAAHQLEWGHEGVPGRARAETRVWPRRLGRQAVSTSVTRRAATAGAPAPAPPAITPRYLSSAWAWASAG